MVAEQRIAFLCGALRPISSTSKRGKVNMNLKNFLAGLKAGLPVCIGYFSVSFGEHADTKTSNDSIIILFIKADLA